MIHDQLGVVYEKLKDFPNAIASYRVADNTTGVARVEENERIAQENKETDAFNAEVEDLERRRKELEKMRAALPRTGSTSPR